MNQPPDVPRAIQDLDRRHRHAEAAVELARVNLDAAECVLGHAKSHLEMMETQLAHAIHAHGRRVVIGGEWLQLCGVGRTLRVRRQKVEPGGLKVASSAALRVVSVEVDEQHIDIWHDDGGRPA